MKDLNYQKGRDGEDIAKYFLIDKGMLWIESNHVNNLGEIDLIMSEGDVLIFIEVKLKIGDQYGTPEEMISKGKIARVKRIAEIFLVINPKLAKKFSKYRIDAVCIVKDFEGNTKRVSHYKNIA